MAMSISVACVRVFVCERCRSHLLLGGCCLDKRELGLAQTLGQE